MSATYYGLLSQLLLEAGVHVTVGHFLVLLLAERRTAPSVWHLNVRRAFFVVVVLAKREDLRCVHCSEETLQGAEAN